MAELKKARAKHMEVCMTYAALLEELQNTKRLDMVENVISLSPFGSSMRYS